MTRVPRWRPAAAAVTLLAVATLAACGPYAQVAQKLDVTARVAADTWIAAAGPDRSEVRILLVGAPREDGSAPFALTSMQMPISRGTAATALQGRWIEVGSSGAATVRVEHAYTLPDESTVPILSRRGTWREDVRETIHLTAIRSAGQLSVEGDARLEGTYVPLVEALARLGTATERDAACAFQVANLDLRSSEVRIIGFGGPGMSQYLGPETYVGMLAGTVRVSMIGFTHNTTTLAYTGFSDLGGVRVDGPQTTDADSGGNGHMSGVLELTFEPVGPDGAARPPITGTIDYGGAGVPADAVQISNGNAVGGFYVTSLAGGGSARVSPETAPSPPVAECLDLP